MLYLRIALYLLVLGAPVTAMGQTQAGDSTVRSPRDSSSAQTDSAANGASAGDSGSADTARSASDSSQPALGENSAAADSSQPAAAATPPPTDSILSAACSGSTGARTTAPDLLVVIFTPESGRAERAAVTKSVRGKLLGQAASEPGAYYLWVPSQGQESRLRSAADQLIQLPQVRQVGTRACPPAPRADTTRPGPTTPPPER